jgi:hypothetical protein
MALENQGMAKGSTEVGLIRNPVIDYDLGYSTAAHVQYIIYYMPFEYLTSYEARLCI